MAWHEKAPSGVYFVCLRVGDQRFKRSLKTTDEKEADGAIACIEENLRLLERGRLEIPPQADVVSFLLSNGRVSARLAVPEQISLRELFKRYFDALPEGNLESTTIEGMKIHQKHLERHIGHSFLIRTLTLGDLQEYVKKRSADKGRRGTVTASTIRKAIVTLRTVWNWGREKKVVEGIFPAKGLKYPKGKEKPPYMPFRDILRLTKGMSEDDAAELWECAFLTRPELDRLLSHVKRTARHPFVYPIFVFAAHAGARRAEIVRARITDVDFVNGFVTIRERKKSHDTKTTRRVPMSGLLKRVLAEWLKVHPGGQALFCHSGVVQRSKKRSLTTGHTWKQRPTTIAKRMKTVTERPAAAVSPITRNEMHDHFKRTVSGTHWESLRGWHVLRHSFCSVLCCENVDQRIIDEWMGHMTEEQRRRYRHLRPEPLRKTITSVFG